jgi:hypothetical protein
LLILYLIQIAALTRDRAADRGDRTHTSYRRHAFVAGDLRADAKESDA